MQPSERTLFTARYAHKFARSTISTISSAHLILVNPHLILFNCVYHYQPDATDEEVIAAATLANVHDVIMDLPDKYETRAGPKGDKLSGGAIHCRHFDAACIHFAVHVLWVYRPKATCGHRSSSASTAQSALVRRSDLCVRHGERARGASGLR